MFIIGYAAGIIPFVLIPLVLYKLKELRNPENITLNILNLYMFRVMIIALVFQGLLSITFTYFLSKFDPQQESNSEEIKLDSGDIIVLDKEKDIFKAIMSSIRVFFNVFNIMWMAL